MWIKCWCAGWCFSRSSQWQNCFELLMIRKASCMRSPGFGLDPHPIEMRIAWSIWLGSMLGRLVSRTRDLHWWCQWLPQSPRFYLHWYPQPTGSTFPLKHCGSTVRCLMQYSRTTGMTWKQVQGPLQHGLGRQEYYSLQAHLLPHSCNSCTIKWTKCPTSIARLAFKPHPSLPLLSRGRSLETYHANPAGQSKQQQI